MKKYATASVIVLAATLVMTYTQQFDKAAKPAETATFTITVK